MTMTRNRYLRYSTFTIVLGLVTYLAMGYGTRSFEAYCPFGGAESLWGLFTAGEFTCALGPLNLSLMIALFLLGLGWNFAYVAGSTLLADQLSPGERSKTQGFNDLMLNLTSAGSQVVSGVVYAVGGYGIMSLAAAAAAVAPLILGIWWQAAGRHVAASRKT